MKSKIRLLWMKLHAYLACFFLPITVLYIVTGVLYLFDNKGDVQQTFEYPVELAAAWPETRETAEKLVREVLSNNNHINQHAALPEDYYPEDGVHDWYGYKQEVILVPMEDPLQAKLIVKEHDIWLQLLLIHKGHAGQLFWVFGVLLGANLFFSLVSGVVLALQLPRLKNNSLSALLAGTVTLILAFVWGG